MCVFPGVQVVAFVPVLSCQSFEVVMGWSAYLGPVPPPSMVVIPDAMASSAC